MKYVYIITLTRDNDDDDYGPHESDEVARHQVARELQEAMDETGLPVGIFEVTTRIQVPTP